MTNPVEIIERDGYIIKIYVDETPLNPREYDNNLGTMACFGPWYSLGDAHPYKSQDYRSYWEMMQHIKLQENAVAIIPIWMSEQSDTVMSCNPTIGALDPGHWDTKVVGFIFISEEKVRQEYNVAHITAAIIDDVSCALISEVEAYNAYRNGNVWGFTVEKNGEEIDCCWSYYSWKGVLDAVQTLVDNLVAKEKAAE